MKKEIFQDNKGNLYFVEYDNKNKPYKVYCDENGNPLEEDDTLEIFQDNDGNLYFVEYDNKNKPYKVYCDENGNPLEEDDTLEIFRDKQGNLYFVEYDSNNRPYKVYCDEYGKPLEFIQTKKKHNNVNNYKKEEKKRGKSWLVVLLSVLAVLLLAGGAYFAYQKFFNSKPSVDITNYEVNFVSYGNEGEGKASIDIKKIPIVKNAGDNESAIDKLLTNPEIVYSKEDKLKNGDKVEVTIKINEHSAKKYKLQVKGEFRQTYTVSGLTEKPGEKIIYKEKDKEKENSPSLSDNISKKDERTRSVIPAAGVNLRTEPNDNSKILTTVAQGKKVKQLFTRVTDNGETWSRVTYNDQEGWMRSDLLD